MYIINLIKNSSFLRKLKKIKLEYKTGIKCLTFYIIIILIFALIYTFMQDSFYLSTLAQESYTKNLKAKIDENLTNYLDDMFLCKYTYSENRYSDLYNNSRIEELNKTIEENNSILDQLFGEVGAISALYSESGFISRFSVPFFMYQICRFSGFCVVILDLV